MKQSINRYKVHLYLQIRRHALLGQRQQFVYKILAFIYCTTFIVSNLAENYIKTANNSWYPEQVVSDC